MQRRVKQSAAHRRRLSHVLLPVLMMTNPMLCCSEGLAKGDALYGQPQAVIYIIIWSMLVLNADAHNPKVKTKMKLMEWVRNTQLAIQGIDQNKGDGRLPLPPSVAAEYLEEMYAQVNACPILCALDGGEQRSCRPIFRQMETGGRGWTVELGVIWRKGMELLKDALGHHLSR